MTFARWMVRDGVGGWSFRSISYVVAAWRTVTRRHVLYTFLLCLAWSSVTIATQTAYFSRMLRWTPSLNAILATQINGFVVLFAVLVADKISTGPVRRSWPYAVAVFLGVSVGSTMYWLISQHVILLGTAYQRRGIPEPFVTFGYRQGLHALLFCGLVTWIYAYQRRSTERLAALRALQLERAATEKKVLESRLAATQARVDPQFLLDTLARVEREYEHDASGADRLLKELTIFLRNAIPRTSASASTVAREFQLADAYLNVVDAPSKDRCVGNGDGISNHGDVRAPPMVLLPLIKLALARGAGPVRPGERFALSSTRRGDRLRLAIHDRGAGFAAETAVDPAIGLIRERLAALYRTDASLTLRDTAQGSEAVIDIPFERA